MKLSVVVIIKKDNSILMYNRGTSLSEEWTVLGGHMNENETIFECAKREVLEEANIYIYNLSFLTVLEDKSNKYISFYVLAEYESGNLSGNIDERIEDLRWVSVDSIPEKLYLPFRRFCNWENIHWKDIQSFLKESGFRK